MDRRQFLTAATVASPFVAGCVGGGGGGDDGGGGEGGATATPTAGGSGSTAGTTIAMRGTAFEPLRADVEAGTTVEWVNEDSVAHTVTSAQFHDAATSWEFDEEVSGGGSVTHTFDDEGVYEYYCTVHGKATMCGAVLVGATLDQSLPCGSGGGGGDGGGDDGGGGGYGGGY